MSLILNKHHCLPLTAGLEYHDVTGFLVFRVQGFVRQLASWEETETLDNGKV